MATKEYFITKLLFNEDKKLIKDVFAYEYDGHSLSKGTDHLRHWMVNRVNEGSQISTMTPNPDIKDKWIRGKPFTYYNQLFSWGMKLPLNIPKRKTFVSYYHYDDQFYRERFENLFGDLVVSKSVDDGDIDSDNCDEYIKQLIQKDYLNDTSVLVVLVGPKTKCRKHVDWEISGGISSRVGGNSGLVGVILPTHPDFGVDKKYYPNNLPKRLAANVKSGYAKLYDWTEDRVQLQKRIEEAFINKENSELIINKSIPQMLNNTCE